MDVLIIIDSTGSMDNYLLALQKALPELIAIASVTDTFNRIGVLSYKDYVPRLPGTPHTAPSIPQPEVVVWSGWNRRQLGEWVKSIQAEGGADYPEAAKSALIKALEILSQPVEADPPRPTEPKPTTIVLWYTDAPPHHKFNPGSPNRLIEIEAHRGTSTDWVHLCKSAAAAGMQVYPILPTMDSTELSFYVMLAEVTGGKCLMRQDDDDQQVFGSSDEIRQLVKTTVQVALGLVGCGVPEELIDPKVQVASNQTPLAPFAFERVTNEDEGSCGYLPAMDKRSGTVTSRPRIASSAWRPSILSQNDEAGRPRLLLGSGFEGFGPDLDEDVFDRRYADPEEEEYREKTRVALRNVFESNVMALTYNPIFAQLWRAICKEETNNTRESLLTLFKNQVEKLKKPEYREEMDKWVDINYDASVEIRKLKSKNTNSNIHKVRLHSEYTQLGIGRSDLLELTTNCSPKVLRKLGDMLRFIEFPNIGGERAQLQWESPLEFFRMLPHLALRGTLYSPRVGALLAVVAVIAGVPALQVPALSILELAKGTWLATPLVPENFDMYFIRLLLSLPQGNESGNLGNVALTTAEHTSYLSQLRYNNLFTQLDSKVNGHMGWTPFKSRGVGDRKRKCLRCGIRRSETVMHDLKSLTEEDREKLGLHSEAAGENEGACGMCVDCDTKNPEDWKDTGELMSCWVECSEAYCKASYVIEDEEGLRIPPRCYYCRNRRPCPSITCTTCGNRIILPASYRSPTTDTPTTFVCPPCTFSTQTGIKTVIHKLTSLRGILFANEYELSWLGIKPFTEVFRTRSTFVLSEIHGVGVFDPIERPVVPWTGNGNGNGKKQPLKIFDKPLLNTTGVAEQLDKVIERNCGFSGTLSTRRLVCGMTFEEVKDEAELVRACGDAECTFKASENGLREWYAGAATSTRRRLCPACWGSAGDVLARYMS